MFLKYYTSIKMVKIKRLQKWAAFINFIMPCYYCWFINLYQIFYNLNTIIFYLKMAQFLSNNMYFCYKKNFKTFLFLFILAYWNRFLKLPIRRKFSPKTVILVIIKTTSILPDSTVCISEPIKETFT